MENLKIYWYWQYVKEGVEEPDDLNRWMIEGNLKIDCSDIEPYEDAKELHATVARITMKGTANADFVNHPSLPKYNIRVNNVLEKSSLFNTGYGDTTQFFDSIEECKRFAERTLSFHFDMLKKAEKV